MDSGWGVRTLSSEARRFNPMSYHNGSVWPHDTALCAAGLRRYGHRDDVARLMDGLFAAAATFDMRLPELFCGFPRGLAEAPVPYPVACLPQAWAAGAVFMLLQACLGLRIDAWSGEVHLNDPALPAGVDQVSIARLCVGERQVALDISRRDGQVVASLSGDSSVALVHGLGAAD